MRTAREGDWPLGHWFPGRATEETSEDDLRDAAMYCVGIMLRGKPGSATPPGEVRERARTMFREKTPEELSAWLSDARGVKALTVDVMRRLGSAQIRAGINGGLTASTTAARATKESRAHARRLHDRERTDPSVRYASHRLGGVGSGGGRRAASPESPDRADLEISPL